MIQHDPVMPFMARWARILWVFHRETGWRLWYATPYCVRWRWAEEWTAAYARWKAAGYPEETS